MNTNWNQRFTTNQAFWERSADARLLFGTQVNITFPMLSFAKQFDETVIAPEMIRPEEYFAEWDQAHENTEQRGEDLFSVASPLASVPWMEAIAGCVIRALPASGSIWAEHPNPSDFDIKRIRFDQNNPWLLKLVEFTQALRDHAAGRYPVGNPILRGVSDMVAALLSPTEMIYGFFDRPQFIHELCYRCAEIWQGVAQELTRAKGSFHDGSCADRRRIWGKGTSLLYQDDAAALTSPELFTEFFLPHIAEILKPYQNTIIHTHSESLPIMQTSLCSVEELKAIEVLLDPSGLQGEQLLERFQNILRYKSIVICGEMSTDLIQLFVENLPSAGLCIQPKVNTAAEADFLWRHYENTFRYHRTNRHSI